MIRRKPAVAGTFYPAGAAELERSVRACLENAVRSEPAGKIHALVAPHAGYAYSAPVAAGAYALLPGIFPELIIVLAPSHRLPFKGAAVFDGGIYETPLGPVNMADDEARELLGREYFGSMEAAHEFEHSLEVQLPFIQIQAPGARVLPLILGSADYKICEAVGRALGELMLSSEGRPLIVISTDLSHYHSYKEALKIDGLFIDALRAFDARALNSLLESGRAEACGHAPLIAGITASRMAGARKVEIIDYRNSGDTAGTKDRVVGYLSAAFTD